MEVELTVFSLMISILKPTYQRVSLQYKQSINLGTNQRMSYSPLRRTAAEMPVLGRIDVDVRRCAITLSRGHTTILPPEDSSNESDRHGTGNVSWY